VIVIDSSALVAIAFEEPEQSLFNRIISGSRIKLLSAANLLETSMVIEKRNGEDGRHRLDYFLLRSGIEIAEVDAGQAELAREAFRRFGKGRHPANLNFGDCFAYALARRTGYPLLYKGGDFKQTDLTSAL
jgi:ribonuclease VapC